MTGMTYQIGLANIDLTHKPMTLPALPEAALTLGAAALIAYLLPKLLCTLRKKESSTENGNDHRSNKSRLLQERFGSLMEDGKHDLQLETMDVNIDKSAKGDRANAPPDGSTSLGAENGAPHSSSVRNKPLQQQTNAKTKKAPATKSKPKSSSNSAAAQTHVRPPFQNKSDVHPGLDAFRYWWDVQTSLYRIYTITRSDGASDPPPYNPSSRRGQTSVDLRVTNDTKADITVFWINYKGGHEPKGSIPPNQTWTQSTWIDHPWVFCATTNSDTADATIAHYIPYKIIPNIEPEAPTVNPPTDQQQRLIGVHRFSIMEAVHEEYKYWIRDEVLPLGDDIQSEQQALDIALLHCVRTGYYHWSTLLQYLRNIQQDRDDPKYRQIRIANRTFFDCVWNTAARGVLLCTGWVEHGAYVELGTSESYRRSMEEIVATIEQWQKRAERGLSSAQPEGADGFGRAGYQ